MNISESIEAQGVTITAVSFVIWLADQIDAQDGGDLVLPENVCDDISLLGFEVKEAMNPTRDADAA